MAVFPELCLTGYSIDDLVMQDAVLDAVEAAIARLVEASAELFTDAGRRCAAAPPQPPVQLRGRDPPRRAARRRPEVVPAHLSRVLRAPLVRPRRRPGGRGHPGRRPRGAVRTRPALRGARRARPVVHAEVCEDVWVPIPPSSQAALAGATVLLNLSGSPITIARAEDRKDLCQSQSLRCLAAYAYAAAGTGESTNDLSWDGQTMIYEGGALLAETERFPDGPRRSVADVDLDRLRQDRLRQGTFDDNRRTHAAALPHRALRARAAGAGCRAAPHARPVPVRPRRPGPARAGLLRGVQHPGVGARAAHADDRAARSP